MPLLLLGIRQTGDKDLELVVYAKDGEPQQVLPLKKLDQIPTLPVELEWQRGEKNVDSLTITILGQYRAVLPITGQAD
jgi:oxalate decarboxylase/phosphoglucose isomerase-like protein (cupin superfamily)